MIDYAHLHASSTSQETAFAHNHHSAIHLLACNFTKCSPISKSFFFTGRLSNKFVKIWLLKILPHLQCVATPTLPCDLSLIVTLVENVACFGHWALQGSAATSIRCGGLSNNHLMANFPENLAVRNFGNRLRSDKVTAISLSSPLLWDTVYTD